MSLILTAILPFYGGSHRQWADELTARLPFKINMLTRPGEFWKWRMRGGALGLAREYQEQGIQADVILTTDMLDVATFKGLVGKQLNDVPIITYFHENQLAYPTAPGKKRPTQLALTNISTALVSDVVLFNSRFHRNQFLNEAPILLDSFPDHPELWIVDDIEGKSLVVPVGLDLRTRTLKDTKAGPLRILWNHRWSHDKQPHIFTKTMLRLAERQLDFRLIVTGKMEINPPPSFIELQQKLAPFLEHFGYVDTRDDYMALISKADVVVSTAQQEYFGISTCEAIYAGCYPLLPNRLNYPALIPQELHEAHLYHKPHQLLERLSAMCVNPQLVRRYQPQALLRGHIAQFDWEVVAPEYIRIIENVVS